VKRLAVIVVVLACAAVVVVLGTGASSNDGTYRVRAIFDSAFSVIKGEDVKVAGVKVGKIETLQVTPDNKAAIVLDIDDPGFADFRADATCQIRPQSLIGEKFVECTPTQPRAPGEKAPPPLKTVAKGQDGAGQHLLPVTNTERTVDLDLINNIMRLPFRERFAVLLNEFGAGLAGNGRALNAAIRRADPALKETDKVLDLLASQNKVLASLARESDTVLAPLAARRHQVADFVVKAGDVAQATADQRTNLERSFARLPEFLRQLRPTMVRLGALSDQGAPLFEDLGAEAPNLSRFAKDLGPFSQAGIPAIKSLGKAADIGTKAVPKTLPITKEVRGLAAAAKPLGDNLRATLESLRDTGGIERALDYVFFQVAAINGFDTIGHYLRAGLIVNTCSSYATTLNPACSAHYSSSSATATREAKISASPTGDVYLDRMQRILSLIGQGVPAQKAANMVLHGARTPAPKKAAKHAAAKAPSAAAPLKLPSDVLPGAAPQSAPSTPATPVPQAAGSQQQPGPGADGTLLDYLLGSGGP
jgi:phospholipid/cholesterol/gamma-HCH transport system substrate-binding protein